MRVALRVLAGLAAFWPTAHAQDIDPLVIDTFKDRWANDLGAWHGAEEGLPVQYGTNFIQLSPSDPDHVFTTQISPTCRDMTAYRGKYLHVIFGGTDKFTISLSQSNEGCDPGSMPTPETWDSVEAARYAAGQHIYVPMSHFHIDLTRTNSVTFHGFYNGEIVKIHKVEITSALPPNHRVPGKLGSGTLALKCKRPNSFAFGIDDGQPQFAQEVMKIIEDEGVTVTFFTVGNALLDEASNFTQVYKEMLNRGHQIALHSFSHPKMEGLSSTDLIDSEFVGNINALKDKLGIESRYFRPPFGTVGARTRQRLAFLVSDPYIINWSVDIEDWLYADSPTPEKQLEAFKRDFSKGGDIAVMHYLNPSTIQYFREIFQLVKASGKQIMRVDQCMMDPNAPPLR